MLLKNIGKVITHPLKIKQLRHMKMNENIKNQITQKEIDSIRFSSDLKLNKSLKAFDLSDLSEKRDTMRNISSMMDLKDRFKGDS